ncbi:ABC transporter substrate-binding protein [Deferribacter thermophilus]|uniref:ABC transporter substrate-binding protein n=1 Tax=Deferribacter thermophilus TaxID=53573 RepID=UPI003C190090
MKFLKWILNVLMVFILLTNSSLAYERVILLSPACADIFIKLGLNNKVVGITKHIKGFDNAVKVGSHLKPNLELMLSLNPDLIIYSNNRFLPNSLDKFHIKTYKYDPKTIKEIFEQIKEIAYMMNVSESGNNLINELKNKLSKIKKLNKKPKVIYEITQTPYIVAGKNSIINDIIKKAGGINAIDINKKLVKFSIEKAISLNPDIYIYQVGPMNKAPTPPDKRPLFRNMKTIFIKVNELDFARANTKTIDNILFLNNIFYNWSLK